MPNSRIQGTLKDSPSKPTEQRAVAAQAGKSWPSGRIARLAAIGPSPAMGSKILFTGRYPCGSVNAVAPLLGLKMSPCKVYNTQGIFEESSRGTSARIFVVPSVLEGRLAGSANKVDIFASQRLDKEDRHLLPIHRISGAEVAAAATASDSPPRELLDVRAERAAGRHVVEHLLARHAGRGLDDIQRFGQSYRHLRASCSLGQSRCRGTKANQRQKNAGHEDKQTN
jgi:hypothetical protein